MLIIMSLTVSFLLAQEQLATISPAKPKIGDEILITYNAMVKSATLRNAKDITAEVLLSKSSPEMPQLIELPMKSESGVWKASFKLSDDKARMLLVRFTSGEQKDDNGEKSWETMVYGANGNALEGAHLMRASMLRSGSYIDFKLTKDADAAKKEIAMERELYPENYGALSLQWSLMMREAPGDETKAKIKNELDALYAKKPAKEDVVVLCATWYQQIGMKEKADEMRKSAIAADPKGKVAESARISEVYSEKDPVKRVAMMEKFLADFPQKGSAKENYENTLMSLYLSAKKYDEAEAILAKMPNPNGNIYNSLAWSLIEKGEQLEKAVAWAKKGVDLLKNPDPASKPAYLSTSQWKKSNEMGLGMILDTYAYGLFQLGKTPEAESAYEEAFKMTKGEEAEINQRLIECYVKNGKYDKAMTTGLDCIKKAKSNEKLVEACKAAYVKVKGSDAGFDTMMAQAKEAAKGDLKKELTKGRVNKPAIDFALKNLEGKVVKLSDLRGKVVVLDFWATWCGPCKASFPYLQQVYNKYKDNPKIVILALNTWENVSGKEREDLVKKFIADNKYTFTVLYDEGFVEKYGVEGIPTKFVIDKKGMIQFKTIGFTGEKMVDEMIMQFDMLLDDNFYSSLN
ncbi:MAG: redoxin domain-containing protein [Bacteroidota bacterium]